jgi:hypothetical protein
LASARAEAAMQDATCFEEWMTRNAAIKFLFAALSAAGFMNSYLFRTPV